MIAFASLKKQFCPLMWGVGGGGKVDWARIVNRP